MNYYNDNKRKKHLEIYIVLFLLLVISVGFSYLSSQLNILGTTKINKQNWNVVFDTPSRKLWVYFWY